MNRPKLNVVPKKVLSSRPKLIAQEEDTPKLKRLTINRELTEGLIIKFCELILKGVPIDASCDYLCIPASSFYTWLRRGEAAVHIENPSENEELLIQFYLHIRKATAEYREGQVISLHTAPNQGWIRHLAILERRDRKSFGKNEPGGGGDDQYSGEDKFL